MSVSLKLYHLFTVGHKGSGPIFLPFGPPSAQGDQPGQGLAQQHPRQASRQAQRRIAAAGQIAARLQQGDGFKAEGREGGKAAADLFNALLIAINLVSLWALPAPGLKKGRPFDPEGTSC